MTSCPVCGSFKYQKRGVKQSGNPQFYCINVQHPADKSRWWTLRSEILEEKEVEISSAPKILLFDIETSQMIVKTFSLYNDAIPSTAIIKDWFIISFSAKWLYDDKIIEHCVTPEEAINRDDKRVVLELNNLLNKADIVIGHNGSEFDIKKANTRFIAHKINPTYNYKEIDTLKMARAYFKFSSNKLDYLGEYLGLGRKIQNEKGLWDKCEAGDKESLNKMVKYCSGDVELLEKIYLQLRPFAKNHPSLALYGEMENLDYCPVCGNPDTIEIHPNKMYENKYIVARCTNCKAPLRGNRSNFSKETLRKVYKRK